MEDIEIIKKAQKCLRIIETSKLNVSVYESDPRFLEYQKLKELLRVGEFLEKKIFETVNYSNTNFNTLMELRTKYPAVDTMIKEIEQGVSPGKQRTEEQLVEGHYYDDKDEDVKEDKDEEVKEEKDNGIPDLDKLNEELNLDLEPEDEEEDA